MNLAPNHIQLGPREGTHCQSTVSQSESSDMVAVRPLSPECVTSRRVVV